MTAHARSKRRVTIAGGQIPVRGDSGRVIARRPLRSTKAPSRPKETSGSGDGVLASAEQEAARDGFLMRRLASPSALCMVAVLGYAVYEVVAAMFMAR